MAPLTSSSPPHMGSPTGLTSRNGAAALGGRHTMGDAWGSRWMQAQGRACGQWGRPTVHPEQAHTGVRGVHCPGSRRPARARGSLPDVCPGAALSGVLGVVGAVFAIWLRAAKDRPTQHPAWACSASEQGSSPSWEHALPSQLRCTHFSGPPSSPGSGTSGLPLTPWAARHAEQGPGLRAAPAWSSPAPPRQDAWARSHRQTGSGPFRVPDICNIGHGAAPNPSAAPPARGPAARWLAGFQQVTYPGFVSPQHLQTNI